MTMTPAQFRALARPKIKALIEQGKLVDVAFEVFCAACWPGAPHEQYEQLKIAFFGGVMEFHTLISTSFDDNEDASMDDERLYGLVMKEVENFHMQTMATLFAREGKPN